MHGAASEWNLLSDTERPPQGLGTLRLAILLIVTTTLAGACGQPPSTPRAPVLLRLAGSSSMQPLLHELGAAYSKGYQYVSFDLTAVGSTAGLELLRRGTAHLALVSRELRPEEEYDAQTGKRLLAYTVIAQDGIAVIVNERNPLRELTLYQLRKVFTGQPSNWEELGGPAGEITVVSREDGSATRAVFEELAMQSHQVTPAALIMPGSEAVCSYVSTHEGAIGYVSMGYLATGIAALAINNVRPERATVEDGTYPLTRPFLLVSQVEPGEEIANFMQFARSPAGQAIVRRTYGGARTGVRR